LNNILTLSFNPPTLNEDCQPTACALKLGIQNNKAQLKNFIHLCTLFQQSP
jgi:hypothetical protein